MDWFSGLEQRVDDVIKEFDEFLEDVLEEHVNKEAVDVEGQDIVDILLEFEKENTIGFHLERDEIKAIITVTFIYISIFL